VRSKLLAEGLGTALLLATIVGSGIMAERLANGNGAIALLANALATGMMLFVVISVFGPVSGAHFNPAVTMVAWLTRQMSVSEAILYGIVQFASAMIGVVVAHAMFALPLVSVSQHLRTGPAQWLSEFVATFGLVLVIVVGSKTTPAGVPALVASYIAGAYWFTASTSFANPAVTVARALTDTFSGIRPADVAMFCTVQIFGALVAWRVARRADQT